MKMDGRFNEQDDSTSTQENVAGSPLSGGDEATEEVYEPSPKKRRGANKRVVTIPFGGDGGGGDGSRSKAEVYPPPDSWSWRKYGQKPIKGSPYPRGYYRCSSSKGCPARKQVERSHLDPTMLLITYSCDHNHNHPLPATTKYHHHSATPAAASTSSSATTLPAKIPKEECSTFVNQPELDPADNGFTELAGEFGWLADVGCALLDSPVLLGPTWTQADLEVFMPIGEEDEFLFGDLGDLPESSVVFRRCRTETPCCDGTG
ncbi:probable WRKY transcription factor 69 isoform X2 [Olea europaea subsp. europaea]|uniref:Probable WRKY transcription factor 69 isoform X2 n=1 Tax=Olea europaea subsp. europaea TaxID=158383 RepID=A0A8S0V5E9_OLEEU|nr:probable WRKY transcription factor 69 isoform X2 [Olea europaea subsp. europaea]